MPARKCVFIVKPDQIVFTTRTNGDHISLDKIHIDSSNGADLAWLIQEGVDLRVEIKEETP